MMKRKISNIVLDHTDEDEDDAKRIKQPITPLSQASHQPTRESVLEVVPVMPVNRQQQHEPAAAPVPNINQIVKKSLSTGVLKKGKAGNTTISSVTKVGSCALKLCTTEAEAGNISYQLVLAHCAISAWATRKYENQCHGDSCGEMGMFIREVDRALAIVIYQLDKNEKKKIEKKLNDADRLVGRYSWNFSKSMDALYS
jgi:hypothetical protein